MDMSNAAAGMATAARPSVGSVAEMPTASAARLMIAKGARPATGDRRLGVATDCVFKSPILAGTSEAEGDGFASSPFFAYDDDLEITP